MALFRSPTTESANQPEDDIEAGLVRQIIQGGWSPEAERRRSPCDVEVVPTHEPAFVWSDGEAGWHTNPDDPVANTILIQTVTEDRPEADPPKQVDEPPELNVNKITWPLIGRVTEPGRYMFRFGWLKVTAADLAIWKAYPNAAFTLIRTSTPPPAGADEELAGEEFRLGTFELRTDSNYSEGEK